MLLRVVALLRMTLLLRMLVLRMGVLMMVIVLLRLAVGARARVWLEVPARRFGPRLGVHWRIASRMPHSICHPPRSPCPRQS